MFRGLLSLVIRASLNHGTLNLECVARGNRERGVRGNDAVHVYGIREDTRERDIHQSDCCIGIEFPSSRIFTP